jgi:hypothetical protein
MVDPDERETAALSAGLKAMAEIMAEIGWERRLCDVNGPQARNMAQAAVGAFLQSMRDSAPEVPF